MLLPARPVVERLLDRTGESGADMSAVLSLVTSWARLPELFPLFEQLPRLRADFAVPRLGSPSF